MVSATLRSPTDWTEITSIDDPIVTTQALIDVYDSYLEGENYHEQIGMLEDVVTLLTNLDVLPSVIKRFVWEWVVQGKVRRP